jgi:hypothetical protein
VTQLESNDLKLLDKLKNNLIDEKEITDEEAGLAMQIDKLVETFQFEDR